MITTSRSDKRVVLAPNSAVLVLETENSPVEQEISKFHRSLFHLQSQAQYNRIRERGNRDTSEGIFSKTLWFKLVFFVALVGTYVFKMVYTRKLFKES